MCRLLGIVKKQDVVPKDIFYDFISLAQKGRVPTSRSKKGHYDGWGFAGFMKGKPSYLGRSPRNVLEDPSVETAIDLASRTRSPVLIGHIRKSSGPRPSLVNAHPFPRDGWIFSHNGTIFDHERLPLRKYTPEGETDSERLFLFLLERIRGKKNLVQLIRAALQEMRAICDFSSLNFLMSDGRTFFAYREYKPQCRKRGYRSARELQEYYTLYHKSFPWGTAVSSEPLDRTQMWRPFHNQELHTLTLPSPLKGRGSR